MSFSRESGEAGRRVCVTHGQGELRRRREKRRRMALKIFSEPKPLAGHADSPDGIHGFEPHEHPPPIDQCSKPTHEYRTYVHATTLQRYQYQVHEGPQNAYGDYTLIKLGRYYYLFGDFDPIGKPMRIGYWISDSITNTFDWGGEIGKDFHPDPSVGFAEGQFYLIVQPDDKDFVSPGPWVDRVEARPNTHLCPS